MSKGLQNIQISFGEERLTAVAGSLLIYQFCKSLQLKRFFQKYLHLSHRNTYYHWADLILSHFYSTVAGIERFTHLFTLKDNGLLPPLIGLNRFPGTRAMRDFLLNLTPIDLVQIEKAHDLLRFKMFQYPDPLTTFTVNFDSVVLIVYGHQEGSARGYNPKKRHHPSYHPLLAFESHLNISLHGELRPGNATNKSEAVPFMKIALNKVPSTIARSRVRVRADAGFYCWSVVKFLDGENYGYVIVAQMTAPIKAEIQGLRYRIFNHQEKLATAEFKYQPQGWEAPHRFIAIRYTLPPEPETVQRTLPILGDRYQYHVFITNLDLEPENIWYFYNGRASVELIVKELEEDFFLTKIPTRKFLSNQAHFQLLLLDYDLFRWFQILCLPQELQSKTLKWIRRHFLIIPGRFITPGHKNTLQFPASFRKEHLFQQIYNNAQKVKSLLK